MSTIKINNFDDIFECGWELDCTIPDEKKHYLAALLEVNDLNKCINFIDEIHKTTFLYINDVPCDTYFDSPLTLSMIERLVPHVSEEDEKKPYELQKFKMFRRAKESQTNFSEDDLSQLHEERKQIIVESSRKAVMERDLLYRILIGSSTNKQRNLKMICNGIVKVFTSHYRRKVSLTLTHNNDRFYLTLNRGNDSPYPCFIASRLDMDIIHIDKEQKVQVVVECPGMVFITPDVWVFDSSEDLNDVCCSVPLQENQFSVLLSKENELLVFGNRKIHLIEHANTVVKKISPSEYFVDRREIPVIHGCSAQIIDCEELKGCIVVHIEYK